MGRFRNDDTQSTVKNVRVCQSCSKTWERWSYGAQSGVEFYSDFPQGGIEIERCLYCVKEMKDAIRIKINSYRSFNRPESTS